MDNEISIDEELLEQICTALDGVTTPDNQLLMQIFSQFQDLHSQLPTFCFYLLYIISSDQFPPQRRLCALIVLNRNFRQLENDLIEKFLSIAKPILEEIIKLPFSPFTTISATMLCSMAKFYGMENFPDFLIISELFTKPDTVQVGLECFTELLQGDQQIPDELLELLPEIINSPYSKAALDVSYLLCSTNETFVYESILPAIFNCYSNFDESSLSVSASISAFLYMRSPNEDIANFLIECFNFNSKETNECILLELSDNNSFEIYPPLIERLLLLMELPDDDVTDNGPCSLAQQILQNASDCHGSKFNDIVKKFIIGHFTFIQELYESISKGDPVSDEVNVGFLLRCLYTILSNYRDGIELENDQEIEGELSIYHTIIIGCFDSIFRGDASLTLMSFCCSNEEFVNDAFNRILPLFVDDDSGVRYQAIVALSELVEFDNVEPNIDHFVFLIDLVKSTNDISIARFTNRYAQHWPVLNDSCEFILDLYRELLGFFISTTIRIRDQNDESEIESVNGRPNKNGIEKFSFVSVSCPIFQSLVDMLSLFIAVVVEPFELLDKRIFVSILFSIENDYFDTSMFSSYFEMILSLLKTYNDDILNAIESNSNEFDFFNIISMILQKVVSILVTENDCTLVLIKDGYSITSLILSNFQSILIQFIEAENEDVQSLIENFLRFSFDHLSLQNRDLDDSYEMEEPGETARLNVEICCLISEVMSLFIPKMSQEVARSFLEKSYAVLAQFYNGCDRCGEIDGVTKEIKMFGLKLIELFAVNEEPVDERIYELFMNPVKVTEEEDS